MIPISSDVVLFLAHHLLRGYFCSWILRILFYLLETLTVNVDVHCLLYLLAAFRYCFVDVYALMYSFFFSLIHARVYCVVHV